MTIAKAAAEKNVSRAAILGAIQAGKLKAEKVGGGWEIDEGSVAAYVPRDYRARAAEKLEDHFSKAGKWIWFQMSDAAISEVVLKGGTRIKVDHGNKEAVTPYYWQVKARQGNRGYAYFLRWESMVRPPWDGQHSHRITGQMGKVRGGDDGGMYWVMRIESVVDKQTGEEWQPCRQSTN